MDSGPIRAARRELLLVLALAVCGVVAVLVVAFTPWYDSVLSGSGGAAVVQTFPPAAAHVAVGQTG